MSARDFINETLLPKLEPDFGYLDAVRKLVLFPLELFPRGQ
jgi:hypothetical protein